jgi:hypothetical protein
MMSELEAILGSDLVTTVFLYGSAACLIVSLIAATWLCETKRFRTSEHLARTRAAFLKVAPHRN